MGVRRLRNGAATIAALALLLAATAGAEPLPVGAGVVCTTTYKMNTVKCGDGSEGAPRIAPSGAGTGCIFSPDPTPEMTDSTGQANVSVQWNSHGIGKYRWNEVDGCVPAPRECSYSCAERASFNPPQQDHADAIHSFRAGYADLFVADTSGEVSTAVSNLIAAMNAVPLGTSFDGAVRSSATSELNSLSVSSAIESDVPITETLEEQMDDDFVLQWPVLFLSLPSLSVLGLVALIFTLCATAYFLNQRRRDYGS